MNKKLEKFWKSVLGRLGVSVKNLQTKIISGDGVIRREFDNYPTPPWAIEAVLDREEFEGDIWECACGSGNIVKAIKKKLPNKVIASDLRRFEYIPLSYGGVIYYTRIENLDLYPGRIYAETGLNFLFTGLGKCKVNNIITNPPFSWFTQFVLQAKIIAQKKIAFFMKLNGLCGVERFEEIYSDKKFPLKKVYLFCRRVTISGFDYTNPLESCFLVWDKDYKGEPELAWIV